MATMKNYTGYIPFVLFGIFVAIIIYSMSKGPVQREADK
jgi:hypothetical protein